MSFVNTSLPWLLEENNVGVRFAALRNIVGLSPEDRELNNAKKEAYRKGPIGTVLAHMDPDGYWKKPGGGYNPKYYSTVWSLILLSQLGASAKDDTRIETACTYYLDHAYSRDNSISYNGTPSGTIDCLCGNMLAAFSDLEYHDKRLEDAYEWMARSVIGENIKYYAYKCGPNFACGANGKLPCAWGAAKVMLAFGKLPNNKRTPTIKKAIEKGVDFLLGTDPVKAEYPTRTNTKPNRDWWKFGFPVFYITDILQIAEAVISVEHGGDPRLKNTLDYIISKQDKDGRWLLEYDYPGKTWGNYGKKNQPNKWVTYRVLKVLKSLQ